jgi:hypothetical protein
LFEQRVDADSNQRAESGTYSDEGHRSACTARCVLAAPEVANSAANRGEERSCRRACNCADDSAILQRVATG